jgi:signal transduction histidine kinase
MECDSRQGGGWLQDVIILMMDRSFKPVRTGSDADLAFAVVVLASYFTTFSILVTATTVQLLILIGLGVAYITVGIYGYAYIARSGNLAYHLAYFSIQLILAGTIIYLGGNTGYNALILLPLAGHSVMLLPRNPRIIVNVLIVFTYAITLYAITRDWSQVWSGMPIFIAGQIFIIVFTQMAVNEEKARSEVEKLVAELETANQNLREYAVKIEELAISKERNRMAREIHDGLGHYLTTIFMHIQAARAVMKGNPQKAMESLGTAQNLTQEALVDVRRSVAALRDAPVDIRSLQVEILKILKGCEGVGIATDFKVLGMTRPLSPQTVLTIYRAAQEGVNNACKHSGASSLEIILDYGDKNNIRMVIQDNGRGVDRIDGGFGILGMRERVHLQDGELNINTSPGHGFQLDLCIPDHREENLS